MGEGDASAGNDAFSERQEFIGISDLLPIYEDFEDGSEVLWEELWPEECDPEGIPLRIFSESDLESEYQNEAEADAGNQRSAGA